MSLLMQVAFLIEPLRLVVTLPIIGTRKSPVLHINGRVTSQVPTCSIGRRCGIYFGQAKRTCSCGSFGIKLWH